jgi:hypothetical protein
MFQVAHASLPAQWENLLPEQRERIRNVEERAEGGTPPNKPHATVQRFPHCTLETFATVTQLPLDFLQQAGLSETHLTGRKLLRVVCRGEHGSSGAVVFQTALGGEERYQYAMTALSPTAMTISRKPTTRDEYS